VTLVLVARQPGARDEVTARVARALKAEDPAATEHVARLAEKGLVRTAPSAVALTPEGQRFLDQVQARVGAVTQRLWGDIPAGDMAVARRVLATVLERAEAELRSAT
jgi:DNA-binding MarR family transcriptional regulator